MKTRALLPLLLVSSLVVGSAATAQDVSGVSKQAETGVAESSLRYVLSTPQVVDPLAPLSHLATASRHIEVEAAVVGVADPLETHLGRAFDIQVSSIIRAFHARDFVLDGFGLTWDPELASNRAEDGRVQGRSRDSDRSHRALPSVLLFRRDDWRASSGSVEARYFVLFLVGESPTFGLHPAAFEQAVKCAAVLDGAMGSQQAILQRDCRTFAHDVTDAEGTFRLRVVGPSFSGSMQSLALSIARVFPNGRIGDDGGAVRISVLSPSASVKSNKQVCRWASRLLQAPSVSVEVDQPPLLCTERIGEPPGATGILEYSSLAATLEDQLKTLCTKIGPKGGDDADIVILAEESTFGGGVNDIVAEWREDDELAACARNIRVAPFPQNIAAIRAEHSQRDRTASESLRSLLRSRRRLLELDLSEFDEALDRPPALHRELSSRSDELMLYGTFDALRVWVKPDIVAVVATDVRDRLFLLNEVRKLLPTALPVLMEMDFLTTHPDYRKISRGSVVIPNGQTLVMMDRQDSWVTPCRDTDRNDDFVLDVDYYSFPSDYSANMFRATLELIREGAGTGALGKAVCLERGYSLNEPDATLPYVTTLAGFQQMEGRERSRLLAADSRLSLQLPAYGLLLLLGVISLLIAWRLLIHGRRHLVMTCFLRDLGPGNSVREEDPSAPPDAETKQIPAPAAWIGTAPRGFLAAAAVIVVIALFRLRELFFAPTAELSWDLPHGRDSLALACLLLLYLILAGMGVWRRHLWRLRYDFYLGIKNGLPRAPLDEALARRSPNGLSILVPSAAIVTLVPIVVRGWPTAVDPSWPSLTMSLLLLPVGAWFLVEFWRQSRYWWRLALVLGPTMGVVSRARGESDAATGESQGGSQGTRAWPSLAELGEPPQAPFSLRFRRRDLAALLGPPGDGEWSRQTRELLAGRWPFAGEESSSFEAWQARLVAEMRYAAVAVRSCAWCGILAPTFVLLGMSVYPPPSERLQTTVSMALIVAGFAAVMYVVLRLERHPLLSRMFTQHGDSLSLSGAVGALWPRVVAAILILVPVMFPDFLDWLYGLLRSIDSL